MIHRAHSRVFFCDVWFCLGIGSLLTSCGSGDPVIGRCLGGKQQIPVVKKLIIISLDIGKLFGSVWPERGMQPEKWRNSQSTET